MTPSSRSILKALLIGFYWGMVTIAFLSFWVGGRLIHDLAHIDRIFAEIVGIAIALLCGALGFLAKNFAADLADPDLVDGESSSK